MAWRLVKVLDSNKADVGKGQTSGLKITLGAVRERDQQVI